MTDDTPVIPRGQPGTSNGAATVTQLAMHRRSNDVLSSITFVFGGVHYGTIPISTPYTKGKPIVLYIVPRDTTPNDNTLFDGPLDCLMTDDIALAADFDLAR